MTYQTMGIEDICKMPISKIADKDCALFLWVTICAFAWVKQNPSGSGIYSGLGHWTNGNAELCLFAKKGTPKRVAKNVKQIVLAPRARHSEKPPEVRDRIVNLLGDLPRIELFARQECNGWDCFENEV